MKTFLLLTGFVATASFAQTYKCAEKADKALKEGRLQYSVILVEGKAIRDPRVVGDNDAAGHVRVSILSRNPRVGGRFELDRPSFQAIATYEDVNFDVDAKRSHGFTFHIFFDEMDQASMSLKGLKKSVQMTCSSPDFN